MNAEAIIAQALEGRFYLVGGRDKNDAAQREQEEFARAAREVRKREMIAAKQKIAQTKARSIRQHPIPAIMVAVATAHGLTVADLTSVSRRRHIVAARMHCAVLLREFAKISATEIGRYLNRDHSSILHGFAVWKEIEQYHTEADRIAREMLA